MDFESEFYIDWLLIEEYQFISKNNNIYRAVIIIANDVGNAAAYYANIHQMSSVVNYIAICSCEI